VDIPTPGHVENGRWVGKLPWQIDREEVDGENV
jgi:hypothetical protein